MLFQVLIALAGVTDAVVASVSAISAATLAAGVCASSTWASVRVSWTLASYDAALYRTDLYKNGSLVSSPTGTSYDETVDGYVEFGLYSRFTASWTYRIDVVRRADNVVVSTRSVVWSKVYGTCHSAV